MLDFEERQKLLEFGKLMELVDDVFAISDDKGKIIYLNKRGKQVGKILDESSFDKLPFCYEVFNCTHLEKIPTHCPATELKLQKEELLFQMMTKVENDYYKLNCTPIYNGNNELKYIIHIAKNETESVAKEKKLLHLNSLLKSIRNLNQFLYIERDPLRILDEACQILYQTSNYIFVGILTTDVEPFGEKIFFHSRFNIDVKFEKAEDSRIYLQFKENSKIKLDIYSKSFEGTDRIFQFEETFENEKFYGIIIPLLFKNYIFGELIIISNFPEKYNQEEVAFLREFADDISLALYTIHIDAEKEKIEQKTRELERFYYTLLSNLPGFVYRCRNDRYWTMEYLSDNFYKITGYKPEEVVGNKVLSFNDLIHKDHQERLWVKWQILLRKRQVFEDEYPIITKNGEIRWVYEQGRGIYDENGNVVALEGYITDITPRKKLEEQLAESEKKYRAIFENSADAIFLMAGDVFIDCNLSALKMFGCERNDIIGKPPYLFSPEFQPNGESSRKKAIDYIKRAYQGEELRFEWLHKKLDGVEFECEVSLNKITYGKKAFLLAIVRDISEKKKALKEIIKLAKALDSIGEAVTITDISNKFIYVNKAFENLYGYQKDEILGKNVYILRTSESLDPKIDRDMFDKLTKEQVWRGELWNKDKNGRKFKILLTVNTIFDENKKPLGYIGVALDLTERIRLEQSLLESEEKFRTLVESMDDIVYTLDTQHRHNGLYGRWIENWGLKEEDFLGKTALEILGNEEGKIHIEMQERCLRGESLVYEWSRTLGKNTYYFQTRISPLKDKNGKIIGIVGVGRDITQLKHLTLELNKFYNIVEQTPTGIFILDIEKTITYANRSLEKIFGINKSSILGNKIHSIHLEMLDEKYFEDLFQKVINEGEQVVEAKIRNLKHWLRIRIFPIKDNNGNVINFVGLINDITKEKEYIQQLKDAKEKAEELNALKNYLLMNFSHEFRTPLNGIMGWAQVLKYQRTEPDIQEIGDIIYKSGNRLLNTVDNIIDYSRIETGLLKVSLKEFEIVDLVREIVESLNHHFEGKKLEVDFQSEEKEIIVHLDEYLVRGIVHAIVHNAFKFTREGRISVSIKKINMESNQEFVEIAVSDTGIGIPADQINLIWKEFYQVSQGLSREFEGQGLGLSIAKKFFELLCGKISVRSEVGKGSTFTIQLPLKYPNNVK